MPKCHRFSLICWINSFKHSLIWLHLYLIIHFIIILINITIITSNKWIIRFISSLATVSTMPTIVIAASINTRKLTARILYVVAESLSTVSSLWFTFLTLRIIFEKSGPEVHQVIFAHGGNAHARLIAFECIIFFQDIGFHLWCDIMGPFELVWNHLVVGADSRTFLDFTFETLNDPIVRGFFIKLKC